MARSNEITIFRDEAREGDRILEIPARIGRLRPRHRDRRSLAAQARRAGLKEKVMGLIEVAGSRTDEKEGEVGFGVGQRETLFPLYRFL